MSSSSVCWLSWLHSSPSHLSVAFLIYLSYFPLYSADDCDGRNMKMINRSCSNWGRRAFFSGNIFASSSSSVGGLAPSCSLDAPGQRKPEGGQSYKEENWWKIYNNIFICTLVSENTTKQNTEGCSADSELALMRNGSKPLKILKIQPTQNRIQTTKLTNREDEQSVSHCLSHYVSNYVTHSV